MDNDIRTEWRLQPTYKRVKHTVVCTHMKRQLVKYNGVQVDYANALKLLAVCIDKL